jgi:hypothetical protein
MSNHLRADGRTRGNNEIVTITSLRPALADIPGAIEYLGGPSRSKFYADLLPQLDVVRFGNRTFVTVESLDRLIAANRDPAAKDGPGRQRAASDGGVSDA